jgi:Helix-turn-helix
MKLVVPGLDVGGNKLAIVFRTEHRPHMAFEDFGSQASDFVWSAAWFGRGHGVSLVEDAVAFSIPITADFVRGPTHPRNLRKEALLLQGVDCQPREVSFDLHGGHRELRPFLEEIKRICEEPGLTPAEVSRRGRSDQPVLSRLESGHSKNPTFDTLWRYAAAVGRRLFLTTEAIRDTRPAQDTAKRIRAARGR